MFSTSGDFACVWTHGATCKPVSGTLKSPTEIWVTEQRIRILSSDSCSETHYEGVSSKLYNWARGREAQKARGRIECSGKTTCQGLWGSQRSNTPLRARIFQPAAERARSSDSRWSKKCFIVCLMNLLIMNSIPWLPVDRDSGAARRRLSASQGYGLSFISLPSVRLISRDNKGTNPPWRREIIFVWTVSCACVISTAIRTPKCLTNKLASQSQRALV